MSFNISIGHQCGFPYKKSADSLQLSLSPARLTLYKHRAGDLEKALQLYCWNMGLCQALYWPLHAFEITLRNALADAIADQYGEDWYEDITSFSTYRRSKQSEEASHIEKSKRKLDDDGLLYSHDNIVAAISMGFWLGLLKQEYKEKLWKPLFSSIYQMIDREETYKKVNQIKRLRNNVAHYEPIIVFLPKGDKRELFKDYKLILKMIRWICPDTADWVEYHSSRSFFQAWNCCPHFFAMPKLTVATAEDEANSQNWRWA